jgi:hypothetical protein
VGVLRGDDAAVPARLNVGSQRDDHAAHYLHFFEALAAVLPIAAAVFVIDNATKELPHVDFHESRSWMLTGQPRG